MDAESVAIKIVERLSLESLRGFRLSRLLRSIPLPTITSREEIDIAMHFDGTKGTDLIADTHPHLQCETVIKAILQNELP